MKSRIRLALFTSGSGTTAEAILRACKSGELSGIEPAVMIASRSGIGAIERAIAAGMPANNIIVIDPTTCASSTEFGEQILMYCSAYKVNLIGQYGWLAKTPLNVVETFDPRSINQHPGPVPWFGGRGMYGIRVHAAVLKFADLLKKHNGRRLDYTRIISQRVDKEYDKGEVLDAMAIPIVPGDTPETLQARALPFEWQLQIRVLQDFAAGREGKCVYYYANPFILPGEEVLILEAKRFAIKEYR